MWRCGWYGGRGKPADLEGILLPKVTAYIGLGSNLGDEKEYIEKALKLLAETPGIELREVAGYYRTEPIGYTEQDWFLNTAAKIKTTLAPHALLVVLQDIEEKLGRVREIHWGPRVIDLDLLIFGNEKIDDDILTVPHPRICERAFVVAPLADISPDLILPDGSKAKDLALHLREKQEIVKVDE